MDKPVYGAVIERGKVVSVTDGSGKVVSLDRPGITTRSMTIPDGIVSGDTVFFFMFADGTGAIISKVQT